MNKKIFVALLIVLGGMVWVYQFFASHTQTPDLMMLFLGLVMVFQGLTELLEDRNAATAQVFAAIRNVCAVLMFIGFGWWLVRQF